MAEMALAKRGEKIMEEIRFAMFIFGVILGGLILIVWSLDRWVKALHDLASSTALIVQAKMEEELKELKERRVH